jgi:hypothetical protein
MFMAQLPQMPSRHELQRVESGGGTAQDSVKDEELLHANQPQPHHKRPMQRIAQASVPDYLPGLPASIAPPPPALNWVPVLCAQRSEHQAHRRKVKDGSCSFLIFSSASSTMGPHLHTGGGTHEPSSAPSR